MRAFTEDDRGSFEAEPVTLEAHLQHVQGWTDCFTTRLPLTEHERRALTLAAAWHDVGKADLRFQAMLRGEPRLSRFDERPAIAKGAVAWDPGARERAGLPPGWRHEVSSVAMAEDALQEEHDDVRDLTLWLIATHHGRGRPFFDAVPDVPAAAAPVRIGDRLVASAATSDPEALIADHLERFERLADWHGAHRLAWLEAILRLADHRASAVGAPEAP
jgi:CRISPR-associated endonuclease/helicase Cas3